MKTDNSVYSFEKDFVPYEQAKELKELGFNESCSAYYHTDKSLRTISEGWLNEKCSAPTYSQAFRFFRDKHNLFSVCYPQLDEWVIEIKKLGGIEGNPVIQGYPDLDYQTYEEAELACLKKLIELVKK